MVARGDLGVEIPAEKVPYLQKMLIKKCNDNYKPVITATQMLDSMIRNPRPTRAEVTDVANAVYDGTDAVMLSGETAQGKYPVEALQMMVHIIENTEKHLDYDVLLEKAQEHRKKGISSAIGYSSVATAMNLSAKCIITPSVTGATARVVSKFKPKADIIGVTPYEETLRKMQIYWGVAFCKPFIFQKTLCTVACMFDLKPGIFFNFIDTESSVTRTDQPLWLPNDSSCSRKCFSFKKFIERAVLFLLILIHRNLVLPDKPRNQHSGGPRIQKRSSDFRDMWIDQSLHKKPSCFMRVNPFQQPILS